MKREETFTHKKYSFISSLQTGYLNLDTNSGSNNERENLVQVRCNFCGGYDAT